MLRNGALFTTSLLAASPVLMGFLFTPAKGDVYPISTTVRSRAFAQVAPHGDHQAIIDQQFGGSGPFDTSAHDADASTTASGMLTCDVTTTTTGDIDGSGSFGTASFSNHWIATSTRPPGTIDNSGSFHSESFFNYSFYVDTDSTLSISIMTTVTGVDPQDQSPVTNAIAVNHYLTYNNNTFTELPLEGSVHAEYPLAPGYYQFRVEHYPNSGLSPWPGVDATATTETSFTIDSEPAPPTLGDMNCDGIIDANDVHGFALALVDTDAYNAEYPECGITHANINSDEWIDSRDVAGFIEALLP